MKSKYGSYDEACRTHLEDVSEHETLLSEEVDSVSLNKQKHGESDLSIVTAHRMLLLVLGILATLMVVEFSGATTPLSKTTQFDTKMTSISTGTNFIMDGPTAQGLVAQLLDNDGCSACACTDNNVTSSTYGEIVKSNRAISTDTCTNTSLAAMGGVDLVNYILAYEKGEKIKGALPVPVDDAYIYQFNGYEWYFESEENRNFFMTNPYYYIPQFGGFCSLAIR